MIIIMYFNFYNKNKIVKKIFLAKTFEQTWDKILRFHKSENGTTKSSGKKILWLFRKNPKIFKIRRLLGTYIFCWGLIKYSIRYFNSNTHVARFAKRNVSVLAGIFCSWQSKFKIFTVFYFWIGNLSLYNNNI